MVSQKNKGEVLPMVGLIILRGPCGGGKTAIAKELAKRINNCQHIDVDVIKKDLSGSTGSNNCAEIALWFCETNRQIEECLKNGKLAIVDEAFAEPYLFRIVVNGFGEQVGIFVIEIFYTLEVHIQRYAQKSDKIHPDNEVIKTHYDFYKNGGIFPKGNTDYQIINDLSFTDPNESVDLMVDKIIMCMNEKSQTMLKREEMA